MKRKATKKKAKVVMMSAPKCAHLVSTWMRKHEGGYSVLVCQGCAIVVARSMSATIPGQVEYTGADVPPEDFQVGA